MPHASGTFEVKMAPQGEASKTSASTLGRMSLDKKYHGDLEATAEGSMLTALTNVSASAGYVAIERVTGTLLGKKGSFVLQHSGIMDKGSQHLSITVVPDSGSEQLAGLSGKLDIKMADGKHFYEFDFSLPA
jgi:hypothetical protein